MDRSFPFFRPHRMAALLLASTMIDTSPADAAAPIVHFDVAPTIACRDVTTDEFRESHPGDMLVEAKIEVSSLLTRGREDDLGELFYRAFSPHRSYRIVDYSPRTELASEYAGGITIEKKRENTKGIGLSAGGSYQHLAHISGDANAGSKKSEMTRYELVAPMEAIAASGTIGGGYGVYFKLRSSRQGSLEGAKEFTLVLRVPVEWRGDLLRLRCEATGVRRGIIKQLDEPISSGQRDFVIGMYLAGDEDAQATAEELVHHRHELLQAARTHHKAIERLRYPSAWHELGAALDIVDAKIPDSWLQQLLRTEADTPFASRLPSEVQDIATRYRTARREMRSLSGR